MRILVTGAAGFVGYAVAALLAEQGHEVHGLTRSDNATLPDGVNLVQGDLSRADVLLQALNGIDGVCHLAARTRVRESWTDPLGYWQTNVGGTLTLLGAMLAAGTTRLVLSSSCVVYGQPTDQPIGETAAIAPSNPYGHSKLAADLAAADLASTGALGAISLRAFNIAGAVHKRPDRDGTRLIPRALAAQHGTAPELVINGDGSAVRDFVHVSDMATAFGLALRACEPGTARSYNIGSGRATSVREVIAVVEEVTGRPLPRRHAPAAREPRALQADSTLIARELGWQPKHSDLREIITDAWTALTSN